MRRGRDEDVSFEQFPAQKATVNSGEPGIGKDAANWLVSQKIVAVGSDTWGVEVFQARIRTQQEQTK